MATQQTQTGTADGTVATVAMKFITGLSIAETSGSAATRVYIRDGAVGGTIKGEAAAVSNGADHVPFNPPIYCASGAYVNISSGACRWVITGY